MTAPLSPEDLDDLRALAGAMIPASQAHGVPGADDAEIFAEIARGAGTSADALRRLTANLGEGPGALDRETLEARLVQTWGPDAAALYTLALMHYYRDDRVMTALGLAPRPPFPLGHPREDADPALLAPVKARAPFWRPAT